MFVARCTLQQVTCDEVNDAVCLCVARCRYGGLLIAWVVFLFLVYRVFTMERTIALYDPYEILEVDRVSDHCLIS